MHVRKIIQPLLCSVALRSEIVFAELELLFAMFKRQGARQQSSTVF